MIAMTIVEKRAEAARSYGIEPFPGVLRLRKAASHVMFRGHAIVRMVRRIVLTRAQREWLQRWYPAIENPRIMEVSGLKRAALCRIARDLGLKKSVECMESIRRRHGEAVRRTCEANGYYDSIRGRKPSAKAIASVRRFWADVRAGLREHPMKAMKARDPQRYEEICRRAGERRREFIRKEYRRMLYNLPRKTKFTFMVLNKYSSSQISHRYNALRRGYFVMDDCSEEGGERYNIYYNEDTRRNKLFEKNLVKDGFKVIDATKTHQEPESDTF